MSAERDELMEDIRTIDGPALLGGDVLADGLIAAGYRKPRTISTIEELDALPEWSVIRSEQATIWEKFKGGYGSDFWAETMTLGKHPSSHIALPATVLHEGA